MGRPPIGERALTAAEKQRRYRERKFGKRNKPSAALVERLQARIRELEANQAALNALVEQLLTRNRELEASQAALDAAAKKLFRAMKHHSKDARLAFEARREFFAEFARQHPKRILATMVTGYQPACDLILGPASNESTAESTLNRAKAAVMAAPGKSNLLIAKEIGVPEKTIRNARRKLERKPRRCVR
jgi:hypothetical protein